MIRPRVDRQQLLDAALAYVEGGWPIFPLRPGTKRPAAPNHTAATCDGSDRRCIDGHAGWEPRATTDPNRITKAWGHRPYGIAIATGPAGLLVVDLDVAKSTQSTSGAETLADLEQRHSKKLPATWTVGTPSGGRHLYYLQPSGPRLGNTTGRLGPGIDTRGFGGYVVAPPTITAGATGGEYWLIDDHPPVGLPEWFASLLARPSRPKAVLAPEGRPRSQVPSGKRVGRYVARAIDGELGHIVGAPEGRRNHTLFCSAIALGQLVGAHVLEPTEAEQLLLDAAQAHVRVGAYSATQARQTIASGMRRGVVEPRRIPIDQDTLGVSS